MKHIIISICLMAILLPGVAAASGSASVFLNSVTAYESGEYQKAAAGFESLAQSGVKNGLLYYNLGNSYYKAGDNGRSILWYERAKKLLGDNADLEYNLGLARAQVLDAQPQDKGFLEKTLYFAKDMVGPKMAVALALVFNAFFWLSLLARRRLSKPVMGALASLFLAFTVFFGSSALGVYIDGSGISRAVVLSPEIEARSGMGLDSTRLFTLHEGSVVRVKREKQDRVFISFGKDRSGWVDRSDLGMI